MITPREMLRDYMTVLNILMQNPDANFDDVVGSHVKLATDTGATEETPKQPEATPPEKRRFTANDIEF